MRKTLVLASVASATLTAAVAAGVGEATTTAAGFCAPMASVKSYHGRATVEFDAQDGGPDVGNGGTYSASLSRHLSDLTLNLTNKKDLPSINSAIFTGTVSGGDALVNDSFSDTGANWQGAEKHSGPLTRQLPDYGFTSLEVLPTFVGCKYQLKIAFGVRTTFTANVPISGADANPTVTGSVFSPWGFLPKSLTLQNDLDPVIDWGGGCHTEGMGGVLACYRFGGGEVGLCGTSDLMAAKCGGQDGQPPNGTATFSWHLTPTFVQRKK